MSLLNKIKNLFNKKEDNSTEQEQEDSGVLKGIIVKDDLDKFDAEFHNPRLQCFYCNQIIESGRVRFFKAPGQTEDSAFHKRCFKKLKEGKLPGQ